MANYIRILLIWQSIIHRAKRNWWISENSNNKTDTPTANEFQLMCSCDAAMVLRVEISKMIIFFFRLRSFSSGKVECNGQENFDSSSFLWAIVGCARARSKYRIQRRIKSIFNGQQKNGRLKWKESCVCRVKKLCKPTNETWKRNCRSSVAVLCTSATSLRLNDEEIKGFFGISNSSRLFVLLWTLLETLIILMEVQTNRQFVIRIRLVSDDARNRSPIICITKVNFRSRFIESLATQDERFEFN